MSATSQARKRRGRQTELVLAEYLRQWWPYATATGSGSQGTDILGVTGYDVEVKARRGLDAPGLLRQLRLRRRAGVIGVGVVRLINQGPADVGSWCVLLRLDDFITIARGQHYPRPDALGPHYMTGLPEGPHDDAPLR